jgi:hypothetical protein
MVHIENFFGCSQNSAVVNHREDYFHFCGSEGNAAAAKWN